jgi:two-component system, chemotaxis family, chemotaxis protein CheY
MHYRNSIDCTRQRIGDLQSGVAFGGLTAALLRRRAALKVARVLVRRSAKSGLIRTGHTIVGKTILTVDDSASVLQMVKMTLVGAGYQVKQAANGEDGLAKARLGAIDMVLTDLNMPIMDGLTLIRELRKLPAFKGIPIVFLTTESDPGMKQKAKAAGATGWITKPFQQDQLVAVARKVLGA